MDISIRCSSDLRFLAFVVGEKQTFLGVWKQNCELDLQN